MSRLPSTLPRITFGRLLCGALLSVSAATLPTSAAQADITVGLIIPTTGSTAALGIPIKNTAALLPDEIGGEKLNLIVVDDASDPSMATTQARKLINDQHADILIGSAMTGAAIAVAGVAREGEVPHIALSPIDLPPGSDHWTFRMPQNVTLMAKAVTDHMRATKVKTLGFIGFADAWGDLWANNLKTLAPNAGIKLVAEERFARNDTSVTGQALKLMAAHPDAILVGASGTASALPQITLRQRGYKGPIYQTHGSVTYDFIRIGGAAVDGTILPSGPAIVPEQLPESAATRAIALDYVHRYEEKYGANSRNQFGAHLWDALQVLKRAVPVALKTAKPGTKGFRGALRDAIENEKEVVGTQGVFNFTKDDHFGLDERARVLLTVEKGQWKVIK